MSETNKNLQKIELCEEQQEAIDAICNYNNFALFSEGADGEMTIVLKCRHDIMVQGLEALASHPVILEIMTNIVIDAQKEAADGTQNKNEGSRESHSPEERT